MSLVQDPVCGRVLDSGSVSWRSAHGRETYYFCSARCEERFRAQPATYIATGGVAEQPPRSSAQLRSQSQPRNEPPWRAS